MAAQRFAVNARVWFPSKEEVWTEGSVVSQTGESVVIKIVPSEPPVTVQASKCFAKEDDSGSVDDMTKLSHLHEPGVLHNLYKRYVGNQIYTYTGSILIAVNPFTILPGLYDDDMKVQYKGARFGELSPHVFAVADNAYRAMIRRKCSQSILISGESGAGKTETTKLVMEYVAELSGRTEDERSVESRVLESNPILEAFGNAKTVRNHNSSRFGKFVQILFSEDGKVSGAVVKAYLLEKSRVVQIRDPERNYHCFYQLCAGATPEEAKRYMLPDVEDRAKQFYYLNQSSCFELTERDSDAQSFFFTKHAMKLMGISQREQDSLFMILSAILHLGNSVFVDVECEQPLSVPDSTNRELDVVATLLQCDRDELEESLTTINRRMGSSWVKSPLNSKAAAAKRDSLAKNLYAKVFAWIVSKINQAISGTQEAKFYIAVLDIYGFEHFTSNSFEQFCINLANEKLQQHFNQTVLKMEQDEYEREKINWTRILFDDNQDCVDLIERNQGILALLDDACKLEASTAQTFTDQLSRKWGSHRRISKVRASSAKFTLHHYAGEVNYSTEEFISKNSDSFTPEHERLLAGSKSPFVSALFPSLEQISGRNKFVSLGNAFKVQLKELMETLFQTEPHYIRCVKPNLQLQPGVFNRELVIQQLRSGGVLEAVRVCSAGYPARQSFADFIDRFDVLNPKNLGESMSDRERCRAILEKIPLDGYQIGITKLFFREGQMMLLETLRLEFLNKVAAKIQRRFRKHIYGVRRIAAMMLQTWWRGQLGQRNCQKLRENKAALIIQKYERARQKRRYEQRLYAAIVLCQSMVRAKFVRKKRKEMVRDRAAITIQRHWRGYLKRRPWNNLRQLIKCRIARKELSLLRLESASHKLKEQHLPSTTASVQSLEVKCDKLAVQLDQSEREKKAAVSELRLLRQENEKLKALVEARNEEINWFHENLQRSRIQWLENSMHFQQFSSESVPTSDSVSEQSVSGRKPYTEVNESTQFSGSRSQRPAAPEPHPAPRKVPKREGLSASELATKLMQGVHVGVDTIAKVLQNVAKEAEMAMQVKKQNVVLQAYNKEAWNRMAAAEKEANKMNEIIARSSETIAALQLEVASLTSRLKEMEAGKARLETETKALGSRLMDLHSTSGLRFADDEQEALLLKVTTENLGFSPEGQPRAAAILFKAMQSWHVLEVDTEEPLFLISIAKHLQQAARGAIDDVAYWLTNAVTLYFLLETSYVPLKAKRVRKISMFGRKEGKKNEPLALLTFKCELWAAVEQLYSALVASGKANLQHVLQTVAQEVEQETTRSLQRSATQKHRQVAQCWDGVQHVLRQTLDQLCIACVPMYLLRDVMKNLVAHLNCRIFNSMMVRKAWCPLTFSHGEALSFQLERIKRWLNDLDKMLENAVGKNKPLSDELAHLEQLVDFLLLDHKPQRNVDEVRDVCYTLTIRQLICICQCYSDDKYGSKGIDPIVVDRLRQMSDDSPLLLPEEQNLTLSAHGVMVSMKRSMETGKERS